MCIRDRLSPDEKVRYEKLMEKNTAFAEWFIADERKVIVDCLRNITAVSYTHLDVYKRQVMHSSIVSGMAQFSGYWQSMSRDIVTCANGIINAVVVHMKEPVSRQLPKTHNRPHS